MHKNDEIFDFLRKSFLFKTLTDWQMSQLIMDMDIISKHKNDTIYIKNEPAEYIYFILRGRVSLEIKKGRKVRRFATLNRGDFLGEECVESCFYQARALALDDLTLLKYPKANLISLQNKNPLIMEVLCATAKSREMVRNELFDWLSDDEAVYMIARRHEFFLILKYLVLFMIWIPLIAIIRWLNVSYAVFNIVVAALGVLATTGIGIWWWKDWRNDYYVVTNKRVIWIERSPFFYESRQEAPLISVLSLKVLTLSGLRLFIDYGNLIVKTYTDEIPMHHIRSPGLMVEFINGLQSRKREITRGNDNEVMDLALRKRLGLLDGKAVKKGGTVEDPNVEQNIYASRRFSYDRLINVRYEEEEKIIYRKHWFVLVKKIWLQSLVILGILIVFYYLLQSETYNPFAFGFWITFFVGVVGLWVYQFLDWCNDIYVVTREKIFDIERKPLGRENKKSALLENILSLEHNRVGIIGLYLNYGTVTVNIGAEKFQFFDVYNPAQVQNEIFVRMTDQQDRLEKLKAAQDRERVADWLAIYHKHTDQSGFSPNSI